MSKLSCHITISLDGFVAGPNQSEANPTESNPRSNRRGTPPATMT